MRAEDFQSKTSGRLVRAAEGHWTFEPAPLPPVFEFTSSLVRWIAEAEQALGRLAGVWRMVPYPHILITPFIAREAVLSSRIEGTVTELDELMRQKAHPDPRTAPEDLAEVQNYIQALELGRQRIKEGMPICLRMIRELHAKLLHNVRGEDQTPGEFRKCSVLIGQRGQTLSNARFVPPAHTSLIKLLKDFEQFLNKPNELPIVILLALAHYQFEAIHPFRDGNGRIGRLLISLMLDERKVLPEPLLYLSAYFEENRRDYYDHLLAVSQRGEWTAWMTFFARGVAEQSWDAIQRIEDINQLWLDLRRLVQRHDRSVSTLRIVDELFAVPFITVSRAQEVLGMTFRAAQQNILKLVKWKILQPIPNTKRPIQYFAPAILQQIQAPVATLPTENKQPKTKGTKSR